MQLKIQSLSKKNKIEVIQILEAKIKKQNELRLYRRYKETYDWQLDFVKATNEYHECCLCAANQIGKTFTGTMIDAFHLTGEYPEDYVGYKFNFAPMCWGLGYSMEKTRDLLQSELFGEYVNGGFIGGLITSDNILSHESVSGTTNAMRSVTVKHKLGVAKIQFWSYSQGQHAIMGDVVDWVHVDEEPKDQSIRPQLLTRTINGDRGKGGRVIYTFTPENGRTELVVQFMDTPSKDQFFMKKGWDDAPHMTEEKKSRVLAQYPDYQRDMRTKGEPMLGHGRIYDISDEFVECDPFEIPDHFDVICGMDFGWDHPQSFVKLCIDRDSDIYYLTNSWKQSKVSANDAWGATKSWVDQYPVAWPHDGLMHEKGRDATAQQKDHYHNAGFNMLHEMATWHQGGNSVENGLYEILDRARKGKLKIFRGQSDFMNEWRQYHRVPIGNTGDMKIVKAHDDILDAMRYAYMMNRFAMRKGNCGVISKPYMPKPLTTRGRR